MKLHKQVVYRAPKFSYITTLEASWEELKSCIADSADHFYQQIRTLSAEDLSKLDHKSAFTIWKYFNRARFRATPYGSFAGVGLFNLDLTAVSPPLLISAKQQIREWLDWSVLEPVQLTIAEMIAQDIMLLSNSSYYFTSNSLRYISRHKDGYQLLDTLWDYPAMMHILAVCEQPTRLSVLSGKLEDAGLLDEDFHELLEDMTGQQLLLTSAHPNIIGQDYFQRTGLDDKYGAETPRYHIAVRDHICGSLDPELLKHLPDLVAFLHAHVPSVVNNSLTQFIEGFSQRFEGRKVPIMEALDPELGIGYDALEQSASEDDFVVQFSGRRQKDQQPDVLKSVLSSALMDLAGHKQMISLDNLPLPKVTPEKPLPNSLNLMFTLADDMICLEHAGGCTANILNGRFSVADESIDKLCKYIASREAQANPDVTFFDIGYLVGSRTDNINRRESFYAQQLPLLTYSTDDDPLSLRDLLLSVQGGELILTSRKTGRRLIPRMASAYNYGHSDLPVYRLLCDLQHQGIHSYLHFDVGSFLPELDCYPRVQYKNIILSPAKWIIKRSELPILADRTQKVAHTKTLLQGRGVSPYFKTGMADQTLVFNMDNYQDLNALLLLIEKQDKTELSEWLLPQSPAMLDDQGKPYTGQFVVSMVHGQNIYHRIDQDLSPADIGQVRMFPPGSQWLYFEIYCHTHRANDLLCGQIQTFLADNQQSIAHWFFIRYNQHGNHLRLRLKLHDPVKGLQLIHSLSELLSPEINSGIVSDIQVKTYQRELERYNPELIEQVELHFHRDSEYVLSLLKMEYSNEDLYTLCGQLVTQIAGSGLFTPDTFERVLSESAEAFGREHHMNTQDFKKLNAQYAKYRSLPLVQLEEIQKMNFECFCYSFISVLNQCTESKRSQLLTDLFHMHVNRLFAHLPRTHEMILYNYLIKDFKCTMAKGGLLA